MASTVKMPTMVLGRRRASTDTPNNLSESPTRYRYAASFPVAQSISTGWKPLVGICSSRVMAIQPFCEVS